jgi:hypothetical protein
VSFTKVFQSELKSSMKEKKCAGPPGVASNTRYSVNSIIIVSGRAAASDVNGILAIPKASISAIAYAPAHTGKI